MVCEKSKKKTIRSPQEIESIVAEYSLTTQVGVWILVQDLTKKEHITFHEFFEWMKVKSLAHIPLFLFETIPENKDTPEGFHFLYCDSWMSLSSIYTHSPSYLRNVFKAGCIVIATQPSLPSTALYLQDQER